MTATVQSLIITGAPIAELRTYASSLVGIHDTVLNIDEHPNKTGTSAGIYIEDIRELQVAVRSQHRLGSTYVILADAAHMTQQAQNALLKLLEEPRAGLQIVLCTETPDRLLDTVRSRCRTIIHSAPDTHVQLPEDTAARIRFMAQGDHKEMQKLASNSKYYNARTTLFEQAKLFIGSSPYQRIAIISRVATKRDTALEFIDVCLIMYKLLILTRYSETMRDEAETLIRIYSAIKGNGNAKLQLLNFVVQ